MAVPDNVGMVSEHMVVQIRNSVNQRRFRMHTYPSQSGSDRHHGDKSQDNNKHSQGMVQHLQHVKAMQVILTSSPSSAMPQCYCSRYVPFTRPTLFMKGIAGTPTDLVTTLYTCRTRQQL